MKIQASKIMTTLKIMTSIIIMTFYMSVTLFPSKLSNVLVAMTVPDYTASNIFFIFQQQS